MQLFGVMDGNLRALRSALGVQFIARDSSIKISGKASDVSRAAAIIEDLQERVGRGEIVSPNTVEELARCLPAPVDAPEIARPEPASSLSVFAPLGAVRPKTEGQQRYVEAIQSNDLTFCVGPAGTGKTYLAVAYAVSMLRAREIKRIVLVRPAVEAGEKLGYLPGDLQAKVNPYLRPLFDAMNDMMSFDQIKRFLENDMIEVIPLAFMRGRTLNQAIIILDEAQNTTISQMLMFLTRLGHGSKMIVTGDDSQVDLPDGKASGMTDAVNRLRELDGIAVVRLDPVDIVRHPLVHRVVQAYTALTQRNVGGMAPIAAPTERASSGLTEESL